MNQPVFFEWACFCIEASIDLDRRATDGYIVHVYVIVHEQIKVWAYEPSMPLCHHHRLTHHKERVVAQWNYRPEG